MSAKTIPPEAIAMRGKWTEGPWEVEGFDPTRVQCEARGEEICDTSLATEKSRAEIFANARLIAASPDLYEALEWLLASVEADPSAENYPGDREERLTLACGAARAALSLAHPPKGEEL